MTNGSLHNRSLYERAEAAVRRLASIAFQDSWQHPPGPAKPARVQVFSTRSRAR